MPLWSSDLNVRGSSDDKNIRSRSREGALWSCNSKPQPIPPRKPETPSLRNVACQEPSFEPGQIRLGGIPKAKVPEGTRRASYLETFAVLPVSGLPRPAGQSDSDMDWLDERR